MIDGEGDEKDLIEVAVGDDEPHVDKPEGDEAETGETGDELIIEIEGVDGVPVDETPLAKKLRHEIRDRDRRIKELEARQAPAAVEIGKKPDLWEDSDGDQEAHDAKIIAWNKRVEEAEAKKGEQQQQQQRARERFDSSVQAMRTAAVKQGVPRYQEAEEAVGAALPEILGNQIPIYFGEQAPALVVALYQHPALLEKIATTAKTDLIQAMYDLRDLSKGVKMVPKRKSNVQPDEKFGGSAPLSVQSDDKKEAALLKKAEQSGNMDEYRAYMSAKRQKAKAA